MNIRRLLGFAAVGVGVLVTVAAAADPGQPARVGRVADVNGTVEQRNSGADWSVAAVNLPVFADTALRSGPDGRAALGFGGVRLALASSGEIRVADLRPDSIEVALVRGRIGVHLGDTGTRQAVAIDLPQGAVWLHAPGDYDIAAGEHMPARIAVFAGAAEFGAPGIHTNIGVGSLAQIEGEDPVTVTTSPSAVADGFTDWWRAMRPAAEPTRLAPSIAGAAALAGNGEWEATSDYGMVWYPKVAGDWAPFRYGRWRWAEPGGWTWIDDAAWGFAPSHYGAWVRIGERWGWVPGPADQAVYEAASVAFLGTPSIGISYAGGVGPGVGWFPLAPGERVDANDSADYRNRRFASVVPRAVFVHERPVAAALLSLPEERLEDAPVIFGALGIIPQVKKAQANKPPANKSQASKSQANKPQAGETPKPGSAKTAVTVVKPRAPKAAVAAVKPRAAKVAAAAKPPREIGRQRALVRMKQVLANAARHAARTAHHHTATSTASRKAAHNRQHLAAARGGAP